jgi:hypothetical protein
MKFYQQSSFFFTLLAATSLLTSCEKNNAEPEAGVGTLELEMDHVVGSIPLTLNTTTYNTGLGDQFTVNTFRYYLSNIKLQKADGTEYVQPESYYLVNQADEASRHLTLTDVPVGDYTGLTFTIGVDSARNVSGVQQGALAPSDMFWTWNSGYIYVKLEGTSPQARTGGLVFHIGGFQSSNNTIRTVAPSLNGKSILVRKDHTPEVHFKVDVLKMFVGPNPVRFAELSNTMGGPNSVRVANNYSAPDGMFRVDHIHAN